MRHDTVRPRLPGAPDRGRLKDLPLDKTVWQKAWQAFLDEDYKASLDLARSCLDGADPGGDSPLSLVPDAGAPTVQDCVVLCARNLFQLDFYEDFEVLLASAGRWGMVADSAPELDVVNLAFACKRGRYLQVVDEATTYIDANRRQLPPVIADFLYLRGLALSHLGDPGRAREDAEAAYAVFRVLGREFDGARTANLLGMIAFREAEFRVAVKWFRRALELHTQLGMIKNMGGNRLNIGIAHYKQGRLGRALTELRAAGRLLAEVDARVSLCRCAIAEGNTLRLKRDFNAARAQLLKAYESANQLMLSREEALALEFLGDLCRDEGAYEKARRYYSRALAVGRSIAPEGDIVMEVLRRQGETLGLMGRHAEAVGVLGGAMTLARRIGDKCEEGNIRRALGESLVGVGDLESARHHAGEACRLLDEVGARHDLAVARLAESKAWNAVLDGGVCRDPGAVIDRAWQAAMTSLDLFLKMEVDHWILASRRELAALSTRRAEFEEAERMTVASDRLHGGAFPPNGAGPIIHVSHRMRDLIQMTDAFADSDEPVLVTGATGTGKELFARRLHQKSRRRAGELVCVNVSAIPETIFAREFFGHVKGSFSGADRDGIGLAARADGGTLFLDEIGDMPLELQPQLLRLLQEGTYQAIGDPGERRADIRLVAATNADLEQLVAEGRFRADLYYRLKILELRLPPLTERAEDILPLLGHFLEQAEGRHVEPTDYFSQESLERMRTYTWPGNVREVAMVARQARIQLASRGLVQVEVGTNGDAVCFTGPRLSPEPGADSSVESFADFESGVDPRTRIVLALAEADGNRAEAARRLGVSRSTLYRRMEKLGIAGRQEAGL